MQLSSAPHRTAAATTTAKAHEPSRLQLRQRALIDDGSCEFESCLELGALTQRRITMPTPTSTTAQTSLLVWDVRTLTRNYDPSSTQDDGSCVLAEFALDCEGNCLNDGEGDGVCDEFEVDGCTDSTACNYSAR